MFAPNSALSGMKLGKQITIQPKSFKISSATLSSRDKLSADDNHDSIYAQQLETFHAKLRRLFEEKDLIADVSAKQAEEATATKRSALNSEKSSLPPKIHRIVLHDRVERMSKLDKSTAIVGFIDSSGKTLPCHVHVVVPKGNHVQLFINFNKPALPYNYTIASTDGMTVIPSSLYNSINQRDSITFRIHSETPTFVMIVAVFQPPEADLKNIISENKKDLNIAKPQPQYWQEFFDIKIKKPKKKLTDTTSLLQEMSGEALSGGIVTRSVNFSKDSRQSLHSRNLSSHNQNYIESLTSMNRGFNARKAQVEVMMDTMKRNSCVDNRKIILKEKRKKIIVDIDRYSRKRMLSNALEREEARKFNLLVSSVSWIFLIRFYQCVKAINDKKNMLKKQDSKQRIIFKSNLQAMYIYRFCDHIKKTIAPPDTARVQMKVGAALGLLAGLLRNKVTSDCRESLGDMFILYLEKESLRRSMAQITLRLKVIMHKVKHHMEMRRRVVSTVTNKLYQRLKLILDDPNNKDHEFVKKNLTKIQENIDSIILVIYNLRLHKFLVDSLDAMLTREALAREIKASLAIKKSPKKIMLSPDFRPLHTDFVPVHEKDAERVDKIKKRKKSYLKHLPLPGMSPDTSSPVNKPPHPNDSPVPHHHDHIKMRHVLRRNSSILLSQGVAHIPEHFSDVLGPNPTNAEVLTKLRGSVLTRNGSLYIPPMYTDYKLQEIKQLKSVYRSIVRMEHSAQALQFISDYENLHGKDIENHDDYKKHFSKKSQKLDIATFFTKKDKHKEEREGRIAHFQTLKAVGEIRDKMNHERKFTLDLSHEFLEFLIVKTADYFKDA